MQQLVMGVTVFLLIVSSNLAAIGGSALPTYGSDSVSGQVESGEITPEAASDQVVKKPRVETEPIVALALPTLITAGVVVWWLMATRRGDGSQG